MISVVTFTISGLVIITLLVTKQMEIKRGQKFFTSDLISKSDTHIREIYHKTVHLYSEAKEKMAFLFKKQIPMHSRKFFNKSIAYLKAKREQYTHNMRNSKLLKKSDGISEFFKNMSNIEKGNGEINDIYDDTRRDDIVELGSQGEEKEVE
jgi:hypothetical protein